MASDEERITIYSPPSTALKKFRKRKGTYYESWTTYLAKRDAFEVTKEGENPTETNLGQRLAIEIWPGMTKREIIVAWQRLQPLFARQPLHLSEYSAFDRGRRIWEQRYFGQEGRLWTLKLPISKDAAKPRSWLKLADEFGTSVEALKKSVKAFKRLLPYYAPDRVAICAAVDELV